MLTGESKPFTMMIPQPTSRKAIGTKPGLHATINKILVGAVSTTTTVNVLRIPTKQSLVSPRVLQ
jgi:hypothetical protein